MERGRGILSCSKETLGTVTEEGVSRGMPDLSDRQAGGRGDPDPFPGNQRQGRGQGLGRSGEENGTEPGPPLRGIEPRSEFTFADIDAQPRRVITSPIWSGVEEEGRTYSPFTINIEEKVPFRTLTGRAHFYLDHEWMRDFGEALPLFRPPLDMVHLGSTQARANPMKTS